LIAACAGLSALLMSGAAYATLGQPTSGAMDFQPPATGIMQEIEDFHNFLLPLIVFISLLVLGLLLWVIIRYNRHANPTPRKFTHNMVVEVIWTIVPVLILVAIAWKSFPLIYEEERIPGNAELTLKVTGNSWRWDFEYPDQGVRLTSNLQSEEDVQAWNREHPDQQRIYLLATDTPLYVPVDTTVRVLITSNDVIHSFAVPALGIKEDAIQGRVNDTWFRIDSHLAPPGSVFFGQCSELCGINHAYMPVEVHAVSRAEFDQWVAANGGTVASAAAPAETPAPADGAQPAPQEPAAPAATPTR
jgi:cytochrome c oxidase subunit 2